MGAGGGDFHSYRIQEKGWTAEGVGSESQVNLGRIRSVLGANVLRLFQPAEHGGAVYLSGWKRDIFL